MNHRIIPEPATRLAALKSGEVHFIQDVPTQDYQDLKGNSQIQIMEDLNAGSGWTMMINVTKPPTDPGRICEAANCEGLTRPTLIGTLIIIIQRP